MSNNTTIEVTGFAELLTILLIVLKLTGYITLSWVLVFLPIIILYGAAVIIALTALYHLYYKEK